MSVATGDTAYPRRDETEPAIDALVVAIGGEQGCAGGCLSRRWSDGDGEGTVNFDDIDAFVAVLSGLGG